MSCCSIHEIDLVIASERPTKEAMSESMLQLVNATPVPVPVHYSSPLLPRPHLTPDSQFITTPGESVFFLEVEHLRSGSVGQLLRRFLGLGGTRRFRTV